MQKRVILTFLENDIMVGTQPAMVTTEDKEKLKAEVREYNKQIVALMSGAADPSAYGNAEEHKMLAAVAAGKGHGATGALYPRWCYEEFDWRFDLVEVDPAWTPEKELPEDSNYNEWTLDGTFGEGELGDMLVKPFDTLFSASLGYHVLPATQKVFERECGKTKLKQNASEKQTMENPDKSASIPDEVKSINDKKEKITRYLCACNEWRFKQQRIGCELVDFPPDEIKCTLPFEAFIKSQGPEMGEIQESILCFLKQACDPSGIIPKVVLAGMAVYPNSGQYGEPGPRSGKAIYRGIPYELLLKFLKTLRNCGSPQITLHFHFQR